jgi:hypothetical protein
MPNYQYRVSLKLTHPSMHASAITQALSLAPDYKANIGEKRISARGRELSGANPATLWWKELSDNRLHAEQILLEDFLLTMNMELSAHKSFFYDFVQSGGSVDYFIGWFSTSSLNMSLLLDADLIQRTAELGINILLCAYTSDDE